MTAAGKPVAGGIYGKLPGYGDFLHRGLPSRFVEPWNRWIAHSILQSRNVLGEAWMGAYLTSPPWRFVIEPGILGEGGWLGVLASSVDQVHRCYPITVALPLPADTRLPALTGAIERIFQPLEEISLLLIDGGTTPEAVLAQIDRLMGEVARCVAPAAIHSRGGSEWLMIGEAPAPIAGLAARWRFEAGANPQDDHPLSAWWHGAWSDLAPASLVTAGLPDHALFADFLDGGFTARGWTLPGADRRAP